MAVRPRGREPVFHEPYRYVPSEIYGAALATYLAEQAMVPGSALKGGMSRPLLIFLLKELVFFLERISLGSGLEEIRLTTRQPEPAIWLDRDARTFDWATETLARTATVAEEAVAARRKSLREIAKVERKINRTQAETSRLLSRLVRGTGKA